MRHDKQFNITNIYITNILLHYLFKSRFLGEVLLCKLLSAPFLLFCYV